MKLTDGSFCRHPSSTTLLDATYHHELVMTDHTPQQSIEEQFSVCKTQERRFSKFGRLPVELQVKILKIAYDDAHATNTEEAGDDAEKRIEYTEIEAQAKQNVGRKFSLLQLPFKYSTISAQIMLNDREVAISDTTYYRVQYHLVPDPSNNVALPFNGLVRSLYVRVYIRETDWTFLRKLAHNQLGFDRLEKLRIEVIIAQVPETCDVRIIRKGLSALRSSQLQFDVKELDVRTVYNPRPYGFICNSPRRFDLLREANSLYSEFLTRPSAFRCESMPTTAPYHDRPDAEATKRRSNVKDSVRKKEDASRTRGSVRAALGAGESRHVLTVPAYLGR